MLLTSRPQLSAALGLALVVPLLGGCRPKDEPVCVSLQSDEPWYGDNRAQINTFLADFGVCSDTAAPADTLYAVFDWDNTVIKNDIGDGTTFHMLNEGLIHEPESWASTSKHLTAEAIGSLEGACGGLGDPLPTDTDAACATAILCIYYEGALWSGATEPGGSGDLCTGADAWSLDTSGGSGEEVMEPAYAWTVSLQAGYTPAEINAIADTVFTERLAASVGSVVTVGYVNDLHGYNRIPAQITDLVETLSLGGFEILVSTASSQHVVEAISEKAGIPGENVLGVRPVLDDEGRITADFEGCGTYDDGQDIINYKLGKRCWLNKLVFGVTDPDAQLEEPSPTHFAAGDSDTDIYFMEDAAGLRLSINRQKKQLQCNAYANQDGAWIVNPMFFEPKGQYSKGDGELGPNYYVCESYGLEDQLDSVYCSDGVYSSETCSAPLQ